MTRRGNSAPPVSLFSFQDIITSVAGILIFLTLMMTVELIRHKNESPPAQTSKLSAELARSVPETDREIARLQKQLDDQQAYLDSIAVLTKPALAEQHQATQAQIESLAREIGELRTRKRESDRHQQEIAEVSKEKGGERERLNKLRDRNSALKQQIAQLERDNRLIYTNAETSKVAWLVEIDGKDMRAMKAGGQSAEHVFSARSASALRSWIGARDATREYVVLIVKPSAIDLFGQLADELDTFGVEVGFDLIEESQTVVGNSGAKP